MNNLKASIDIGSNSVLLLIADLSNGQLKDISRKSEITSLGKELDKNLVFSDESMQATSIALKKYVHECDQFGIDRDAIIITATEASRVAQNAKSYFEKVGEELGVKIHIISSEAEAYFSTKGIIFNSKFDSDIITIMDVGGASTELIRVNTKTYQILDTISMPIGSVRSSQWLEDQYFVQNLQKIFVDFRSRIDSFQTKNLICVAGTMTSLANMHLERKDFVEDDVHGLIMKAEDLDNLFKHFSDFSPEQFNSLFPFLGKRANSIRGGLHLVYHLVHRLFVKEITISTYGLRYGSLLEGRILQDHLHGK
jgi:exopolyphosphatase/guanosine-5'-triphosphate,3'-diphosphate pyrophosphatase